MYSLTLFSKKSHRKNTKRLSGNDPLTLHLYTFSGPSAYGEKRQMNHNLMKSKRKGRKPWTTTSDLDRLKALMSTGVDLDGQALPQGPTTGKDVDHMLATIRRR